MGFHDRNEAIRHLELKSFLFVTTELIGGANPDLKSVFTLEIEGRCGTQGPFGSKTKFALSADPFPSTKV